MSEKGSNESQEEPVLISRVTAGRQPTAMTPLPAELAVDAGKGTDAAQSPAARGRQPMPMTPVRPEPAQSPAASPLADKTQKK